MWSVYLVLVAAHACCEDRSVLKKQCYQKPSNVDLGASPYIYPHIYIYTYVGIYDVCKCLYVHVHIKLLVV